MTTKKLINHVDDVVDETLNGLCTAYPKLTYHPAQRVVLSHGWDEKGKNKVTLISGGGSGHEPFAAGFVGKGMLTAAIAGNVFASPPADHILHALKCVSKDAGSLVIIPNYTGDCLNFGIAMERAKNYGFKVADILSADDCSIPSSDLGRAGRRGLVGILFLIKITGALSERGKSLEEITHHAKIITENIGTYGVGLTACSLPGQGPMLSLPVDEIEVGMGVHGEAGYSRMKSKSAKDIVGLMLKDIAGALSLRDNDDVAVIVNNFGGASQLEQGIVVHEIAKQLKKMGINPVRIYSGVLMTSLDSSGFHISVLKLPKDQKDLYIQCLDDETDAPCWPGCSYSLPSEHRNQETPESSLVPEIGRKLDDADVEILKECLKNACQIIVENEEKLNNLDRGCGDGDCGSTHRKLASGILTSLESLQVSRPASLLIELAGIAEKHMGGTSGAVYNLLFTTVAGSLAEASSEDDWMKSLAGAWKKGMDTVMKYSKAQLGDRTMLDALQPAWQAFNENSSKSAREAMKSAVRAAEAGCNATKDMIPRAGRASYVKNAEFLKDVDAGAYGVVLWLTAISETISN